MTTAREEDSESTWARVTRRKVVQWGIAYSAAAWGFLQGLAYVSSLLGWPAQLQKLTGLALLIGLPIALVLAWYHGDRGEQRVGRTELAVLTVLFLLGGGLFWRYEHSGEPSSVPSDVTAASLPAASTDAGPSIAVLPFENRSDEHKDAFFVDGIHDDILTQLTKISALKVISRTSVEQFRNTKLPTKAIAQQLGVKSILEGGVQRAGERVRINVQLIDARTDTHLWAETYDRALTAENIFAIQTELAAAIAGALKAALTPAEAARANVVPTRNLEAWEAYQLGKQRMARRTGAALAESVEYFHKAIGADPGFALAYAELADALLIQVYYGYAPRAECLTNAEVAIRRSLALDGNLAEAHTSLAKLFEYRDDNEHAELEYRKAIELNPNYATAYHWYAVLLADQGRLDEALQLAERAEDLNPLSAIVNNLVALVLDKQGRFDEALAGYRKALGNDPAMPVPYANIAALYAFAYGRLDLAAPFWKKAIELDPSDANPLAGLGLLWLDLGDDVMAEQWLNRAVRLGADSLSANDAMAVRHLYKGEQTEAMAFARRSFAIDPRRNISLALLRNADLAAGKPQAARARYAQAFPELLAEAPPTIDGMNYQAAVDLAVVLQKLDEREGAEKLLDRCEEFIRAIPRMGMSGYLITDAQILALRGRPREALTALRAAEKSGWRNSWRYYRDFDPALASIRNEPEFKAVFADIERDMARQRAALAAHPKDAPLHLGPVH